MTPEIEYERDGAVARIWLNRPSRRNALTVDLLNGLDKIVTEVEHDPSVRVLVLRGRGGTFCSGFDLDHLRGGFQGDKAQGTDVPGAGTFKRLSALRKPSIAVLEGYATAGGFELMLACDLAVAADTAEIGDLHIRRALIGGAGPIYRVPRMIGIRRTKELLLTGKLIGAAQAQDWGLVNAVVAAADLDAAVDDLIAGLVDKAPYIMGVTKQAVDRSLDADTETLMLVEHLAATTALRSADAREGVAAFLEKRPPAWAQVEWTRKESR